MSRVAWFCLALLVVTPSAVIAQDVDGYASTMIDTVPGEDATEWRSRLYAERQFSIGQRVRFTAAGFAEGLLGTRGDASARAAILRPQELHVEFMSTHADLRVGMSRVAWGRLDEFLPTDVINPLDLTRFFLEGRNEARLPVAMVRGRLLPSDNLTIEGVYVPFFRRGSFDQLDEESSPFNLVPLRVARNEPAHTAANGQGGVRTSLTTGRIDWAVMAYSGIDPFPEYVIQDFAIAERFHRFTMVGGDFETVRGEWGLRGEVALRDDRREGGVGVDRRAGSYRVSGTVLVADTEDETDASVIATIDRAFARETRHLRLFAVYNPGEESVFLRVIGAFVLRDNVTLETSGGLFNGDGSDVVSQLSTRDFAYVRVKVFF